MKRSFLTLSTIVALLACTESAQDFPSTDRDPATTQNTEPVSMDIQSGKLNGTWLNAGDNTPVVIMVPGSGPTDKEGNGIGFKANMFKSLAEELARSGISTVRVDKRGMFSSKAAGDPNKVTVDIYAEDYRNWMKTVTQTTGRDCAFLLGHSEGGLMVTAAAVGQKDICGVLLLSAPGFRLGDVLRKQLNDNPANAVILDDAMNIIDTLEAGETANVTGLHPALQQLFAPVLQDYWISLYQHDPAELLGKVNAPKIVIQGSHDIQVSVEDAKRLADISGAELVILDGISHVLKPAPAERNANIRSYNSPDKPVDGRMVQAVADFIKDNSR